jgi:phage protein D|nr:contractile injection system protein, VgrG/Pvc8 family [Kofleriaceae bacterium]
MGLGVSISYNGTVDAELAGASTLEVHERAGEVTRFRARYEIDIGTSDLPVLSAAKYGAGAAWTITVPSTAPAQCLVKGIVHAQRVHFEAGGDGSYVEVIGGDTSIALDRDAKSMQWDNASDSDVVGRILRAANYTPDTDSTDATHEHKKHTLIQRESDLAFVRRLARRNGFLFWVTADATTGLETAHFKRPPVGTSTGTKLTINQKTASSLRSLDLRWDVERPTSTSAHQLDLNTKQGLDGSVSNAQSPLSALASTPLSQIVTDARSIFLSAPVDVQSELTARSQAALIDAAWFVRASCETELASVGALVRPCTVVELVGAGKRHSGKYFVAGVRHTINPANHRMDIELVRNAWEST